jgi:hypothetical protein
MLVKYVMRISVEIRNHRGHYTLNIITKYCFYDLRCVASNPGINQFKYLLFKTSKKAEEVPIIQLSATADRRRSFQPL